MKVAGFVARRQRRNDDHFLLPLFTAVCERRRHRSSPFPRRLPRRRVLQGGDESLQPRDLRLELELPHRGPALEQRRLGGRRVGWRGSTVGAAPTATSAAV
jgi:hypothetical protein